MESKNANSEKFRYSMITLFLKDHAEKIDNHSSNSTANTDNYFMQVLELVKSYQEIILDKDGTILTWSKVFLDLKGYAHEEAVGQNINLIFLPTDRQSMVPQTLLERAFKEGTATHFGLFTKKDGNTFRGSLKIVAIKKDKKEILGYTVICRKTNKFSPHLHPVPPAGSADTSGN